MSIEVATIIGLVGLVATLLGIVGKIHNMGRESGKQEERIKALEASAEEVDKTVTALTDLRVAVARLESTLDAAMNRWASDMGRIHTKMDNGKD